jgi:predicted hydrocarbon binding protein
MVEKIPASGYYNTNTFALVTLKAVEEITGTNGVKTILRLANLPHLIDNYPPHDREKVFDFSDYSSIMQSLEEIYGRRGGRVFAMRVGSATFAELLGTYGALVGVGDLAFRLVPLKTKVKIGINAMAKIFNMVSDQETVIHERPDYFYYVVKRCPVCWERSGEDLPVCFSQVGLIKEGLRWVSNGLEFEVKEVQCQAMGHEECAFQILKEPIS